MNFMNIFSPLAFLQKLTLFCNIQDEFTIYLQKLDAQLPENGRFQHSIPKVTIDLEKVI